MLIIYEDGFIFNRVSTKGVFHKSGQQARQYYEERGFSSPHLEAAAH